jgi:CheY-like chemotaxis protein
MRRKILLADDSITIQKVVNLTFSDEGIDVVTVGNGELAINKLADVRPDIVLADVWMPGRDGYELCEYVKTTPEYKHLPVLLLVGAFEPFDKVRAAAVKADGHLTKPFESRALVATVKKLLEQAAPVITEAFTPPPPLTGDSGRTQIFGSVVNPKPVDSQPRPVASDVEVPPPTIKISPSQLEDGRNTDLDPLIPVPPAEPVAPSPSAESVLELTIPEQNEPILVYPEPPPTLASPIEPPTFASPEPPAIGVATSRLAPGELETMLQQPSAPKPTTDTSPLEIDDVIETTHHPVMPESAAVRDPLLDTFADVAESTSSIQSAFDPAVETTAYTGTEAAFVSKVAGEAPSEPTAAPIPAPDFAVPVDAPPAFQPYVVEESASAPFVEPELKETTPPAETTEDAAATATNRTTLEVTSPVIEVAPEPVTGTAPIETPSATEPAAETPPAPVFEVPVEEDERVRGTDLLPAELVASMRAREAAKELEPEAVAEPDAESPPPPGFTFELPPDNEPVVEAVVVPPSAEAAPVAEIAPEPEIVAEPIAEPVAETPVEAPTEDAPVATAEEAPSAAVIVPAVVAGVAAIAAPMVAEAVIAKPAPEEETVEPEGPTTGEINPVPVTGELVAPEGALDAGQVPQAVIDEIVKRVVTQISEKVIREIAWEVVPDLAELLIKKHLASTNGAK